MTACEAMTVAAVAARTIGIRAQCGKSRKKGLSMARGVSRISAPWPM